MKQRKQPPLDQALDSSSKLCECGILFPPLMPTGQNPASDLPISRVYWITWLKQAVRVLVVTFLWSHDHGVNTDEIFTLRDFSREFNHKLSARIALPQDPVKSPETAEGTISHSTAQGRQGYQEDRYTVASINIQNLPRHGQGQLMAVMDGHGGFEVAEIVQQRLKTLFESALVTAEGNVEQALRLTVKNLCEETKDKESGSTLSVVYIPENEARAYAAILGDSPVIILDKGDNLSISPQHNIRSNHLEFRAALERGAPYDLRGYIYDPRGGTMTSQTSRSLGDSALERILSREPEIYSVELSKKSFVLIATDGLFDPTHKNMESNIREIILMVRHQDAEANELVQDAIRRRTRDNVTALLWRAPNAPGSFRQRNHETSAQLEMVL